MRNYIYNTDYKVFIFKAHNFNINDTIDLHCNCCHQSQKSFS